MGRLSGSLNKDHAQTRQALAASLAQVIMTAQGKHLTFKELAAAVKVDPGTLRHYFADRRGTVRAAFEALLPSGEHQKERAALLAHEPARKGLHLLLTRVVAAWPQMLGGMHTAGFIEGMSDPEIGQAYVATILEPTLDALEKLLVVYATRGELVLSDVRVAGLALLSPVLVALFHQHQLTGRKCRPLDLTVFIERHLDGFLRGHGPTQELTS